MWTRRKALSDQEHANRCETALARGQTVWARGLREIISLSLGSRCCQSGGSQSAGWCPTHNTLNSHVAVVVKTVLGTHFAGG